VVSSLAYANLLGNKRLGCWSGMVWLEAPESAIQSVMAGWFSVMVLNELVRDYWSQHPVHRFHAGPGSSWPIGCMCPGWTGSGAKGGADAGPTC
jgi:hypothetical protein